MRLPFGNFAGKLILNGMGMMNGMWGSGMMGSGGMMNHNMMNGGMMGNGSMMNKGHMMGWKDMGSHYSGMTPEQMQQHQ